MWCTCTTQGTTTLNNPTNDTTNQLEKMGKSFNPVKNTATPPQQQQQQQTPTVEYAFSNRRTPTSHQTTPHTMRVRSRSLMMGAILFAAVGAMYGYTIYNMQQDDWSDVMVPDALKQQQKEVEEELERFDDQKVEDVLMGRDKTV